MKFNAFSISISQINIKLFFFKVLKHLKSKDYPIDDAINICKQHNFRQAQAFILARCGAVEQALLIYFEIAREMKHYQDFSQLLLFDIIELIRKNGSFEIWNLFLNEMSSLGIKQNFEKHVSIVLNDLIEELSQTIGLTTILKVFLV